MFVIYILLLLSIFMGGFYYPGEWLLPAFALYIVTGLVIVYRLIQGRGRFTVRMIAFYCIPLLFALPLLFGVESVDGSIAGILKWLMIASFAYFAFREALTEKGRGRLFVAVQIVGMLLAFLSLGAALGLASLDSYLLEVRAGVRMAGPFGYPNVFGAVIGIFPLLGLAHLSRHTVSTKMNRIMLLFLPLQAFLLIASGSRGAWFAFLIAWLVGLVQLRVTREQLLFFSYTFVVFVFAAIGAYVWMKGSAILLIIVLLLSSGAVYLLHAKWKCPEWKLPWWVLPSGLSTAIVLLLLDFAFRGLMFRLLPGFLQERIVSGTGTLTERFLYGRDLLDHAGLFIWNGAGSGAWTNMMYQVQSEPYISHELHNGYLNWLLELGIFGFVLLICGILVVLYRMIRLNSLVLPAFLLLLLHALIDFDFSYGFVLLLGVCLMAMAGLEDKTIRSLEGRQWIVLIPVLALLFAGSYFAYKFQQAEQAFVAVENAASGVEAEELLEHAVRANPYAAKYRLGYTEMIELPADETRSILEEGLKYEPHHALLLFRYGESLIATGDEKGGMQAIERSIRLDPFDKSKYERYMRILLELASEIDGQTKRDYLSKIHTVFQEAERKAASLEKHARYENQRQFHLTEEMKRLDQAAR